MPKPWESWSGRLVAFVDYGSQQRRVCVVESGHVRVCPIQQSEEVHHRERTSRRGSCCAAGEGALVSSSSVLLAGLGSGEPYPWKVNDD